MKYFTCALLLATATMVHGTDNPADPKMPAPAVRYESSFTHYRFYQPQKTASWKDINREVEQLGGHMGHVREPTSISPPPSTSETPEKRQPSGHKH